MTAERGISLTENIKYVSGAEEFFKYIMWTTKMKVIIAKASETERIKIEFKMITMTMVMMIAIGGCILQAL